MTRVTARVYATLRHHQPQARHGEAVPYDLTDGTTVRQFLEGTLQIAPDRVKVVFVNGQAGDLDRTLADGDRLDIFPPVAGG